MIHRFIRNRLVKINEPSGENHSINPFKTRQKRSSKLTVSKVLCLPLIGFFAVIWISLNECFDTWHSIPNNLYMSLTMIVGAFIAGGSSEGGGAIAFPVLTLIFGATPLVGSTYSLAIQSFGMTSASTTILRNHIPIAASFIRRALPPAFVGFLISKIFLVDLVPIRVCKILFTSMWLSFITIIWFKAKQPTTISHQIRCFSLVDSMFIAGFALVGGGISALFGSGIDILLFTLMTLRFNLCEKVATSSSVIMMTAVSLFGTAVNIMIGKFPFEVIEILAATIPVVIIVAPLGALFASTVSRDFIKGFLISIILVQFFLAFFVLGVDFTTITTGISGYLAGLLIFFGCTRRPILVR